MCFLALSFQHLKPNRETLIPESLTGRAQGPQLLHLQHSIHFSLLRLSGANGKLIMKLCPNEASVAGLMGAWGEGNC